MLKKEDKQKVEEDLLAQKNNGIVEITEDHREQSESLSETPECNCFASLQGDNLVESNIVIK